MVVVVRSRRKQIRKKEIGRLVQEELPRGQLLMAPKMNEADVHRSCTRSSPTLTASHTVSISFTSSQQVSADGLRSCQGRLQLSYHARRLQNGRSLLQRHRCGSPALNLTTLLRLMRRRHLEIQHGSLAIARQHSSCLSMARTRLEGCRRSKLFCSL